MPRHILSIEERFWAKVNKTRSCWLWTGAITAYGHGTFSWPGLGYTAHRIAWILTHGPILPGFIVCHQCGNKHCVKPTHMALGVQADNNRDSNRSLRGGGKIPDYRKPILSLEERFWRKVSKGSHDTCWLWQGHLDKDGYGHFSLSHKQPIGAHRMAWILTHDDIPKGISVCHTCDTPACVNPAHLWLGTCQDNTNDRVNKGRQACGERSGHYTHPERSARGNRNGSVLHPERLVRGEKHWTHLYPKRRLRGERHGNAKLTDTQYSEVCTLYQSGNWTQEQLAQQYGMTRAGIGRIIRRYRTIS